MDLLNLRLLWCSKGPMGVVPPLSGVVVLPSVVYVAPTYAAPAVVFWGEFHPRFGWSLRHPQRSCVSESQIPAVIHD